MHLVKINVCGKNPARERLAQAEGGTSQLGCEEAHPLVYK